MKIKIFLIFLITNLAFANILTDFKNQNYQKICNMKNIETIKNEKLLSLVGISCVKIDKLYLLPFIIRRLKHTKIGRLNSIYLLTIYTQKKLLYSYFFDNLNLSNFSLPDTDYIISHVFYKIKNHHFKVEQNVYIVKYNKEIYKIYKKGTKLFIDEYKNNKLIKRHWFR